MFNKFLFLFFFFNFSTKRKLIKSKKREIARKDYNKRRKKKIVKYKNFSVEIYVIC